MFAVKRNQIIITALVVMIAVAGYLNYSDSKVVDIAPGFAYGEEGDISALVPDGQALMVNAPAGNLTELTNSNVIPDGVGIALLPDESDTEKAETDPSVSDEVSEEKSGVQSAEPGEAMFVSANIDNSTYFVQAKLDREQSRSKQKESLMEMINNKSMDETKKAECADAMMDIIKRIEKESAAEAMIEAKGFKEVFVRIDDNTVDVVVSKESLTDAEIAQIEDIIKRKTGIETSNIRISPMKK